MLSMLNILVTMLLFLFLSRNLWPVKLSSTKVQDLSVPNKNLHLHVQHTNSSSATIELVLHT